MNRRNFIKIITTSTAALASSSAWASPALFHKVEEDFHRAFATASEFNRLKDSDIDWVNGFSNGTNCTFDDVHRDFCAHAWDAPFSS